MEGDLDTLDTRWQGPGGKLAPYKCECSCIWWLHAGEEKVWEVKIGSCRWVWCIGTYFYHRSTYNILSCILVWSCRLYFTDLVFDGGDILVQDPWVSPSFIAKEMLGGEKSGGGSVSETEESTYSCHSCCCIRGISHTVSISSANSAKHFTWPNSGDSSPPQT